MIGYHYTSLYNWNRIKYTGLMPYAVKQKHVINILKRYDVDISRGIFIFTRKQKGVKGIGAIFYQFVSKRSYKIVKLEITYSKDDLVKLPRGINKKLTHDGAITIDTNRPMYYHHNEPFEILPYCISPNRIKLIKTYNLKELLGK